MTNERAIELLKRISDSQFDGEYGDERREALSMAVRALEPNLSNNGSICTKTGVNDEDRTTDDTIYRQDAIDIVRNRVKKFTTACVLAVTEIENLPSVQPQACDDAISRDDAIMAVKTGALSAATIFGRTDEGATAYYETVKAIKALPSAQPERKKGKWIKLDMHAHIADHKCTACGQECYVPTCMGEPMYIYCPNCGARMDGGVSE